MYVLACCSKFLDPDPQGEDLGDPRSSAQGTRKQGSAGHGQLSPQVDNSWCCSPGDFHMKRPELRGALSLSGSKVSSKHRVKTTLCVIAGWMSVAEKSQLSATAAAWYIMIPKITGHKWST